MISGMIFLLYGQRKVLKQEINPIVLENIDDGIYTGEFKSFRWTNKIEVKIENHKIIEINILKDQMFPQDEITNQLFDLVITEQSIEVDAISEATVTSIAYLKSIEDALENK